MDTIIIFNQIEGVLMLQPTQNRSQRHEQSASADQHAVQSRILNNITDQDFYLDLISMFLQLSKESGITQQEILSICHRLLLAKGIKVQSLFHHDFDHSQNQSSQKMASRPPQFTSKRTQSFFVQLLSKLQTEFAFARQKDSHYHALKNFAAEKIGDLVVGPRKKEQTKQERFYKFCHRDRKQVNINSKGKLKQGIQQTLMKIAKAENESHQLMRRVKKLKTMFGHRFEEDFQQYCQVFNCIFDATQKLVISAGEDGLIKVWSRENGQLLSNLKGHESYIIKIVVSPCNKYLISTASDGIRFFDFNCLRTLGCWNSSTVIDVATFYQNGNDGMRVIFSQAKRLMLLREEVMVERGNRMEILTLSDFQSFSLRQVNKKENNNICQIIVNEKKTLLLAFQCGQIVMLQISQLLFPHNDMQEDQDSLRLLPYSHIFSAHRAEIMEIRWNQQCDHFTTGCKQGICKVWQSKSIEDKPLIISEFKIPKMSPKRKKKQFACNYLVWNCTGTHIVASFHQIPDGEEDDEQKARGQGQILIYSFNQNTVITQLSKQFAHVVNLASITSIDAHPYFPNILLFCDKSGKIFIVDIFLKTIINLFQERGYHLQHPQFRLIPTQCHFSKDGTNFIVGTEYGTISIYGYDIGDFYRIAPDQQFLKTDYLPFTIHSETLRPIVPGLTQQLRDINQIPRGQVCNMLGAPYRGMLSSQFVLFKSNIDRLCISSQIESQGSDRKQSIEETEALNIFIEKVKGRIQQYVKRQDAYKSINEELHHNHETIINGQNSKYRQQVQHGVKSKIQQLKNLQPHHLKSCFGQVHGREGLICQDRDKLLMEPSVVKQRPKRRLKKLSERNQIQYQQYASDGQEKEEDFQIGYIQQEKDQESDQQFEQSSSEQIYAFRNRRPERTSTRPVRSVTQNRKYFQDFQLNQEQESFNQYRQTNRNKGRLGRRSPQASQNVKQIGFADDESIDRVRKKRKLNQNHEKRQINLRNLKHQQFESQNGLCQKCLAQVASNSCQKCRKSFCNQCKYSRGKQSPYTCFQCKFRSNQQFVEKKNVSDEHFRQTKRSDNCFVPQIGDEVVYFFQGYQQFISGNLHSLNNKLLREKQEFNILPHQRFPQLLSNPICIVTDVQYVFPLRQPRITFFNGDILRHPRQEQRSKHIQMILKLSIQQGNQSKQNIDRDDQKVGIIQFMVFFVPKNDFLIRREVYEESVKRLKINKLEVDSIVKDNSDQELQIVELGPFDYHFPSSIWKYVKVRKTDGKSLRRNKSNEKRINIWDIDFIFDIPVFKICITSQQDIIVSQISKLLSSKGQEYSLFADYVDQNSYPKYREQVQVGMCLLTIKQRASNYYYRSIESLSQDILRIHSNSLKFNGSDSQITKVASNLVKLLLSSFQNKKNYKYKSAKNNIDQSMSTRNNTKRQLKLRDSQQSQKQSVQNSPIMSSGFIKQKIIKSDEAKGQSNKNKNTTNLQMTKIDKFKQQEKAQKILKKQRKLLSISDNESSEIIARRKSGRNSNNLEQRSQKFLRSKRNQKNH